MLSVSMYSLRSPRNHWTHKATVETPNRAMPTHDRATEGV